MICLCIVLGNPHCIAIDYLLWYSYTIISLVWETSIWLFTRDTWWIWWFPYVSLISARAERAKPHVGSTRSTGSTRSASSPTSAPWVRGTWRLRWSRFPWHQKSFKRWGNPHGKPMVSCEHMGTWSPFWMMGPFEDSLPSASTNLGQGMGRSQTDKHL